MSLNTSFHHISPLQKIGKLYHVSKAPTRNYELFSFNKRSILLRVKKFHAAMCVESWWQESILANKLVFGMSFNAAKVLFVDVILDSNRLDRD